MPALFPICAEAAILRQYLDDKEADVKTMELPEKGEVTLNISSTPAQYQFYVKLWREVP